MQYPLFLTSVVCSVALCAACVTTQAPGASESPRQAQSRAQGGPPASGGQRRGGPPPGSRGGLQAELVTAAVQHLDTPVDEGGEFSIARYFVEPRLTWVFSRELQVSIGASYRLDDFDFNGTSGLPALRPWGKIETIGVSGFVRWAFEREWTLFAIPTIRSSVEQGADFDDAVDGGLITGVTYRFGDTLTLGPGFGYITQLEDSASVFPVLLIQWKLADDLMVRTGSGIAATQGPGLTLVWDFADGWDARIGGRYESLRFRLDDDGAAPGGIGEVESFPFYATVSRVWDSGTRLSLLAGVDTGGRLRLDDRSGTTLATEGYDPAASIGLILELKL